VMTPMSDPPRLIDAGLPCGPLLRQYRQLTAGPAPVHRRSWRPALLGGLVVATLGLCLAGRGGPGVAAGGGSEGASGSAPATGGVGGTACDSVRRS
jgi:hypothetical protein